MSGADAPTQGVLAPAAGLFSEPWWLDAAAPGSWDEVRVEQNGEVVARLPYVIRRKLGITALGQPALTPWLGPSLRPFAGKHFKLLGFQKDALAELIAGLPRFDLFSQAFSPAVDNWLPFYWAGFQATVRYTQRIPDLSDLDAVWEEFKPDTRRRIRKAEKEVQVRDNMPLDEFLAMQRDVFARQSLPLPFPEALVERLDAACAARGVRSILSAEDESGRVHSAWYFVWDDSSGFALMGGGDPEFRASGAGHLIIWEAIRLCARVSSSFDFAGSVIERIESFNRGFGARLVPHFLVTKARGRGRPAVALRDLARRLRSRG